MAVCGIGYSAVLTPSGRLLRRCAHAEDRPALFAAQFALSHACWLVAYPLAGALMTVARAPVALLGPGFLAALGIFAVMRRGPRETRKPYPIDKTICRQAILISPSRETRAATPIRRSSTRCTRNGRPDTKPFYPDLPKPAVLVDQLARNAETCLIGPQTWGIQDPAGRYMQDAPLELRPIYPSQPQGTLRT